MTNYQVIPEVEDHIKNEVQNKEENEKKFQALRGEEIDLLSVMGLASEGRAIKFNSPLLEENHFEWQDLRSYIVLVKSLCVSFLFAFFGALVVTALDNTKLYFMYPYITASVIFWGMISPLKQRFHESSTYLISETEKGRSMMHAYADEMADKVRY